MFFNIFETLDYRLQDFLYQKTENPGSDIIIVAIDDKSLEALGRWPWPRDYHGELIRLIEEGEPLAIGYDVIFSEESDEAGEDEYLTYVISEEGNVVLPVYGTFEESAKRGTLQAVAVTRPFTELDNAAETGHINTIMDNDGIVRKTLLDFEFEEEKIESFTWKLYKFYENKHSESKLRITDIPLNQWRQTYIRFSGKPYSFEYVPFHMVLNGDILGEYFRDRIVLVGPTAIGLADDYYFTPMAPQVPMYGVEIHANIIKQFIDRRFWVEIPLIGQYMIMLILGVLGYFVFNKSKPGIGAIALLGLSGMFIFVVNKISAGSTGHIMSFIYPVGFIAAQYVAVLGEKFILEQLEKKRVTDVFGKYVAPQIVDKILEEGEEGLQLGGARRDITVLFVDIRGFTPLSEAAEPEEVVSILNDYLTLCAKSIFAYGGTLDKYIGDAAMALYNAPLSLDNHQLRAVQTAWAMHEGARPLQEKLEKQFGKVVRFGVGIHTGSAIVGNIGADFRMDYTAIGDTVNTAARIEANSKPGQILISQEVYDNVRDFVDVTDIGQIQVKGKAQPLQVYQVDNLKII